MIRKMFCKIGWHWLTNHEHSFVDRVSGNSVFEASCNCGKKWLTDSLLPLIGFRVLKDSDNTSNNNRIMPLKRHHANIR